MTQREGQPALDFIVSRGVSRGEREGLLPGLRRFPKACATLVEFSGGFVAFTRRWQLLEALIGALRE